MDDLDGLDHLDGEELGAALLAGALADTEAGDRGAVVRTGPTGLQIWIQLQEPRHSPGVWFSQECVEDWHSSLGGRLLSIAQDLGAVGGQNDLSACAAGRWGRRPGWRMTGGQL